MPGRTYEERMRLESKIRSLIKKHPNWSDKRIADELGGVCYKTVRRYRNGNTVKPHRVPGPGKDYVNERIVPTERWAAAEQTKKVVNAPEIDWDIPDGDLRKRIEVQLTGKVGIISDVHAPYHHAWKAEDGSPQGAYYTALRELKEAGITTLLINGDFVDWYALSFHEKVEGRRDLVWEIDVARQMIAHLRRWFGPTVRIVYREGNHEERWARYIARNAPDFSGVTDLELPSVLRLSANNVEWVSGRAYVRCGKLWVDHGHEWFGGGGVNPARNIRIKAGDNMAVSHFHRTSSDLFREINGSHIAGWSIGCLCDLNPHYLSRNQWNHGYMIVTVQPDGKFEVDNRFIL